MEGKFHHVTYNDRKRNYTVISLQKEYSTLQFAWKTR